MDNRLLEVLAVLSEETSEVVNAWPLFDLWLEAGIRTLHVAAPQKAMPQAWLSSES